MPDLSSDLETYADELYTRRDLHAGLKIAAEISGVVALAGLALTVLTVWLPAVGVPVSAATVATVLRQLALAYVRAPTEERKQIRAVVRYLKLGFTLGDRLVG